MNAIAESVADRFEIIGVVNLTSGSQFTDSVCTSEEALHHRAQSLFENGCTYIEIGGRSTSLDEWGKPDVSSEAARVQNALLTLYDHQQGPQIVDTRHREVVEAALSICPVGLNYSGQIESLLEVAVDWRKVPILILPFACHLPKGQVPSPTQFARQFVSWCTATRELLGSAIGSTRLVVDPGLGFLTFGDKAVDRFNYQVAVIENIGKLDSYELLAALPWAELLPSIEAYRILSMAAFKYTNAVRVHEPKLFKEVVFASDQASLYSHE